MKIGITGSRSGLTEKAKEWITTYLRNNLCKISELHHGDCVGVDEEIHNLVINNDYINIKLIIHPPSIDIYRAYCQTEHVKQKYNYIKRNHNIVNNTDILFAFPPTKEEVLRSGTWCTIRYAIKKKHKVCIIYPDGTIEKR